MKRFFFYIAVFLTIILAMPAQTSSSSILYAPLKGRAPFVQVELTDHFPFQDDAELLDVDFINVGIGDAVFVQSGGETMLIDGGTRRQSAAMMRFLEERDIRELTYLFNTHAHDDHIEGIQFLIRNGYRAGEVLSMHPRDDKNVQHAALMGLIDEAGIPFRQVHSGETMMLGKAALTFIRDERKDAGLSLNAMSMMLLIRYGNRSIFLPADVSGESLTLAAQSFPDLLSTDIMKSPHHGINRLREDFLGFLNLKLVVITNNRSGGEELASQLLYKRIPHIYTSTGTLHLQTDGEHWFVHQAPDK